ncbi:glycosyltransferase family protein [Methylocaldum szegediense]|uniref:Beta-1,4-N-acetylglucosaminyltransferase n=1 Tax=Methylocaldum szegediense TaxID=73780 RepID=A0ABN8WYG8_9GAMM|nr:hypothetical protein [Methylocaldum szegediense]CAI8762238.1 beta-1,4-N-acetylglucosaminyltransferase [Methylocaldum szegediense]
MNTHSTDFSKKKVLVTLGGGGHLWQSKRLISALGQNFYYCYVTGYDCLVPPEVRDKEVYQLITFATISGRGIIKRLARLFSSLKDAFLILRKANPDVVICVGTSLSVPLSLWANLFGKKVVFIESITRIQRPSVTGRILSSLKLIDRLYVQWPEATNLYKGAIYKGTVL